jgi:hypothetical protein
VRRCSSAGKGIIFLFAYWDVSDCFSGKVDALNTLHLSDFRFYKIDLLNVKALAFPLKQLLLFFWQMKK